MSRRHALPLPDAQPFGLLSWLVAASTLLAVLSTAAALGLTSAAGALRSAAASQLIVQIVDADADARARDARRAIGLLRATAGVRSAALIGEDAMRAVLRPYLGELPLADLPVPAMITVALAPGADRAAIARRLAPIATARVDSDAGQSAALDRLVSGLRRASAVGAAVAIVTTCLMAVLATRAAVAAHGATVEIVHTLGATDGQLSAMLARRTVREAAAGACVGLLGGIAAILLLADRLAALDSELSDSVLLGWSQWALLLTLPFAIVLLAATTARLTMLAALRQTP